MDFLTMFAENFTFPAVITRELRAGVPQIRGTATSIGGFVIRSLRGPANRAIRIGSFPQFVRIFGSYDPNSYGAEQVDGFFKNGGSACYVVRVLGTSAGGAANTKASKALLTTGAAACLSTIAYSEGTHGNALKVRVTKVDNLLGKVLGVNVAFVASTEAVLTAGGIAKVTVGDTIRITDGANFIRFVVKQISGLRAIFETTTTPQTGLLTAASSDVFIETFEMTIYENLTPVMGPLRFLRMSPLSLKNYFVTRINNANDENAITVTDASPLLTAASVDNRPVNVDAVNGDFFTLGDEFTTYADSTYIGVTATNTGIFAFNLAKDVRRIAVPGITGTAGAVTKALVDYAALRQDCFAITAVALGQTPTQAQTFKNTNIGESSYGAMYYPWFEFSDPLTSQLSYTPPDGFVMGMFARTDRERGLQKSPAGELTGKIAGVTGVERVLSDDDKALVYGANINMVLKNDTGVHIMGARTLEKGEFEQIHKRLVFMYVRTSLSDGMTFVIEEPNTDETRARVRRTAENFLEREWRKGLLQGKTVEEGFFATCDESNNPVVIQKAQQMVLDVGLNVPDTTEFLVVNIQQDLRGGQQAA